MATTSKKTIARPGRRTKAEVEKEFAEVRAQVEEAREDASPKLAELERLREAETRSSVEGVTVENVVERISGLGRDIAKALAGLSDQLTEEVSRLVATREAVELEKRDLERLHKMDVAATALDQMVEEYARQKQELEQEIAAQRTGWEDQTQSAERDRKELEDALKKQRQREIEDYEYKKALDRKKAQEKKNQEKQEALEKGWKQREAALREREDELARLREEVGQFPGRLEKEVQRAAAEANRQAEARFEQQILVLRKDAETEKRLADLRVKTLEEALAQQAAQVTALQKQLEEAKQQVQDIALKAIEGASGSKTLAHVNQIAMEQAKHRSPQG
jgi:DNA repair exonuclease SbcCD ATPase subunit